jgi:hypothetical protein
MEWTNRDAAWAERSVRDLVRRCALAVAGDCEGIARRLRQLLR